jgi:hypothetical protein
MGIFVAECTDLVAHNAKITRLVDAREKKTLEAAAGSGLF